MDERTCSVDGCENAQAKREWCEKHYMRWYRHGAPTKAKRDVTLGTPERRFWAKVAKSDTCWEWTASVFRDRNGYGKFQAGTGRDDSRITYAHRFSYEIHHGPIPDAMFVCHHCDNPLCVRPDHLFLGTPEDNVLDMTRKGRGNARIPVEVVREVKRRLADGDATQREIAEGLGLELHDVKNIRQGSYAHITI